MNVVFIMIDFVIQKGLGHYYKQKINV